MAYNPTNAPAHLETFDGLRKWIEEELRNLAQNYADDTKALEDRAAAAEGDIEKLTNNQFARVARITSTQSITSSVLTKVQFNSVTFDPSSIWDATNFRFQPTVAGYYRHNWNVYVTASSSGAHYACSAKNGTRSAMGSYGSGSEIASSGSDIVHLNGTTDYVEVQTVHVGVSPVVQFAAAGEFTYSSIELVKAD